LAGESDMPVWVSAQRRFPIGARQKTPTIIANIGGFFLSLPRNQEVSEDRDFSLFYSNVCFGSKEKNFA